ncbi:hypothetical protein [Streptomyces sp. URMC 129]|uniref:hypothetical protein n=1 Tax=Streptomyces sp. URMC 129 TaxID=3423407 RepID=UPI003F1D9565
MNEIEIPDVEPGEGTGPFSGVDPDAPNASRDQYECMRCGAVSGWADAWAPGKQGIVAMGAWRMGHREATGHQRYYRWTIQRRIIP